MHYNALLPVPLMCATAGHREMRMQRVLYWDWGLPFSCFYSCSCPTSGASICHLSIFKAQFKLSYLSSPTLTFLTLPPHVYAFTLLHSAHTDIHALSFGQLVGSLKAGTKSHNVWPLVSSQTPSWLLVGLLHYQQRSQAGSLSDGAIFSWDFVHGELILRPGCGEKVQL